MAFKRQLSHLPASEFTSVRRDVADFKWRSELTVAEMPSPQRIAPYSLAIEADIDSQGTEIGSARLVILHDPEGSPAWDGRYRCVAYVRCDVDIDMATDPLLADVGWTWLKDGLDAHEAEYRAASGTVTAVTSRSFGGLATEPDDGQIEIRASWSPELDGRGIKPHLAAWQELLCYAAGLPPIAEGVVAFTRRSDR